MLKEDEKENLIKNTDMEYRKKREKKRKKNDEDDDDIWTSIFN